MEEIYLGPTVEEAANSEIRKINIQIEELRMRLRLAKDRARVYAGSKMLESERLATRAEAFQMVPLEDVEEEV
jgi:hypothetical protein